MQRFSKLLLAAGLVLVLGLGAAGWWHARSGPPLVLRTAKVKRGTVETTINASGTIEPMEVVDVGAQVAGRIKSFGTDLAGKPVDYGSVVGKGAVLANIDDSVYAADFAVAKAQVQQAAAGELSAAANLEQMKAKLMQAEAEWKRSEELYKSKLISQSDFDTAEANYRVAKSDVSVAEAGVGQAKAAAVQAQAGLDKAQRNLDFCIIQSPVQGVIIDRRVNIGQTVVASLNAPSLFLIAKDLTKMQIWASVNEADVGRIKVGGSVNFTCSAFPGRTFEGTVDQVRLNATMTQNIVIYTVVVNTENSDKVLLPYLTANVNFVVRREKNALLVPKSALNWSPRSVALIAPDCRSSIPADSSASASDPADGAAKPGGGRNEARSVIWVKEGEYVRPVQVSVGASDGINTAVSAEALSQGAEVVTGQSSAEASKAAGGNPFLPRFHH